MGFQGQVKFPPFDAGDNEDSFSVLRHAVIGSIQAQDLRNVFGPTTSVNRD
jgi:hypothetical protein